jgi:hypothetical protein
MIPIFDSAQWLCLNIFMDTLRASGMYFRKIEGMLYDKTMLSIAKSTSFDVPLIYQLTTETKKDI